jgi:uncharacterized protein with ParB-like and HNH nuclease domain
MNFNRGYSSVQAKQINFLQFLQGAKQFVIPIYQRAYSWQSSECEQLWDDILRVAQNESIPTHFLGSIVYVSKGVFQVSSVPELLVIDGQQRLTTLFLLLAALGDTLRASRPSFSKGAAARVSHVMTSFRLNLW